MFLILSLSKDAQPNCSAVQARARSIDIARQHFAFADMVGGADDALGLHALDDARGAIVADLQVALDEARRRLALAAHQRHRLVIERIARAALAVAAEHSSAP